MWEETVLSDSDSMMLVPPAPRSDQSGMAMFAASGRKLVSHTRPLYIMPEPEAQPSSAVRRSGKT